MFCLQHYAERIRPLVCDTVSYMHKALQNESANIIVEGANALMLDIDFGEFKCVIYDSLVRNSRHTLPGWNTCLKVRDENGKFKNCQDSKTLVENLKPKPCIVYLFSVPQLQFQDPRLVILSWERAEVLHDCSYIYMYIKGVLGDNVIQSGLKTCIEFINNYSTCINTKILGWSLIKLY